MILTLIVRHVAGRRQRLPPHYSIWESAAADCAAVDVAAAADAAD